MLIIDFYLSIFSDTDIAQSYKQYHYVSLCPQKKIKIVRDDAKKNKDLFDEGKVYIDHSKIYEQKLLNDAGCFSTVSHPNNQHLIILLSAILYKAFNADKKAELNSNNLHKNYIAPQLVSNNDDYFMMRKTGPNLAGKIIHLLSTAKTSKRCSKKFSNQTTIFHMKVNIRICD